MSEAQLKAPNKSPDAGVWLEHHGDYLFKYASFRLRDQTAAEDAVQETFLAALKAYEKFEGEAPSDMAGRNLKTQDYGPLPTKCARSADGPRGGRRARAC